MDECDQYMSICLVIINMRLPRSYSSTGQFSLFSSIFTVGFFGHQIQLHGVRNPNTLNSYSRNLFSTNLVAKFRVFSSPIELLEECCFLRRNHICQGILEQYIPFYLLHLTHVWSGTNMGATSKGLFLETYVSNLSII